ncbi:hypothetical protein [Burkholderia sp. BCC1985]|uniref:hypothetical protein n=1 Tax=Burkholderia sp. BCC1985 TaxID=2817442 RepID=UPI002AB1ED61|nr:hypothetical protein [Burkholderia sp. BCC1985]
MSIFFQRAGQRDYQVLDEAVELTLESLKSAMGGGAIALGELLVFVENGDEPLTSELLEITLVEGQHHKLHAHHCRHVEVTVHYDVRTEHHKFSPATTVGKVLRWAESKFGIAETEKGHLQLQLVGTSDRPVVTTHLGALTRERECSVAFDLLPAHRIQG